MKRIYVKPKYDKSGVTADARRDSNTDESPQWGLSLTDSNTAGGSGSGTRESGRETDQAQEQDQGRLGTGGMNLSPSHGKQDEDEAAQPEQAKSTREIDILYENQRGWFLCGIPLYSHQSLLPIDPSAWVNRHWKDSPVNITNAQVPDPSWEWAWKTWYVDMTGDVDEQGWEYSFSFRSSSWHGTHPWFHSFVRRRRWIRLRVKQTPGRSARGRSGFERAHMLNEDYFTIHSASAKRKKDGLSLAPASTGPSAYSRATTDLEGPDEDMDLEEITDIPSLMRALKRGIVDREKIEYLKKFVERGGEELYYLDDNIPEIMSLFIFQNSRWQFLAYLTVAIEELSGNIPQTQGKEADEMKRRYDNLSRAADSIKRHITGPNIFDDGKNSLLNLTPAIGQECSSAGPANESVGQRGSIKGIPKQAEIEREGHLY